MLDTKDPAMGRNETVEGLTADGAVKLVRELCAGLAEEGGFHGNIWPGSVSVGEDGCAVLGEGSDTPVSGRTAAQVEYLSPEFFWDNEGTAASDVYSLGLMLYAGCNDGYLPFQPKGGALTDKDRSGALRKRMKGETIPLPHGVSEELGAVISRALAYEPEARYATPADLLAALGATDEALPGEVIPATVAAAAAVPAAEEIFEEEPAAEEPAAPAEEEVWIQEEESYDAPAAEESAEPAEESGPDAQTEPEADAPAAAEEAEPPAGEERKYTVQKDFEKNRGRKAASAAPASRRKKKTSPVVPILCIAAAAAVIGGSWYALNHHSPQTSPTMDLPPASEPVVVLPAESPEATEKPAPVEDVHTVQMTDLMEDENAETPEENAEAGDEEAAIPAGSAVVDGMDVEASSGAVYVAGSGVNLRSGPGTAYDVAQTLSRGTKLQRTGTVNGWTQVQYEGAEYYVSSSLVAETDPTGRDTAESADSGNAQSASAPAASPQNAALPVATAAPVAAPANTTAPTSSGSTSASVSATRDVVTVTGSVVNLRTGPDTGSTVVTTLEKGAKLQRTGTVNGWSRVVYKGQEAYIHDSMIETVPASDVTAAIGTLKVTSDVNVRTGPSLDGTDIISVARAGEVLPINAIVDGKWYRVTREGEEGYVNRKLISVQDFALVTEQSGTVV